MTDHVAGRELDALVAEKVFGYECDPFDYGPTCPVHGKGKNYSTDIAAAWQVVEKLMPTIGHIYPAVDLETGELLHWCAVVETGDTSRQGVTADTAPRAICLAALKAVGEATDE